MLATKSNTIIGKNINKIKCYNCMQKNNYLQYCTKLKMLKIGIDFGNFYASD